MAPLGAEARNINLFNAQIKYIYLWKFIELVYVTYSLKRRVGKLGIECMGCKLFHRKSPFLNGWLESV